VSWFGSLLGDEKNKNGTGDAASPINLSKKPAHISLVGPAPTVGQPYASGNTSVFEAGPSSGLADVQVIATMNAFPLWKDVLSGPTHKGAMQVPTNLQDQLMAVQLSTGKVLLIYETSSLTAIRFRLTAMRTELEGANYQVERNYAAVSLEVMRELRVSAESRVRSANSDTVRSESVELLKRWVAQAKEIGATDLHCSIGAGNRGIVQVRVHGLLEDLPESRSGLTDSTVLSVIKTAYETMADRNSNSDGSFSDRETRSCMIESGLSMANLRLRFTSQRGFFGPKAVMRLLTTDINNKPMPFEAMGFAPSHLALFEKAQRYTSGIILQCGVTGSGKTTAAKTLLETHPLNGQLSIYQVADPVEYILKGVHQINVQRNLLTLAESGKKDPYSEVIESLMRMDPDVVDVGEIRDVVSARAAANAAKTGHLVLGTLHANTISGIFGRLTDPKIGLAREELTASRVLGLLTYQALLPVLCKNCALDVKEIAKLYKTNGNEKQSFYVQSIASQFDALGQDMAPLRYHNPNGCASCRNRGTSGLTIVAEMLVADDDEWLDLCAAGKDRAAWRYYRETYSNGDLSSPNMDGKTVMEHAIYKATRGEVDPTNVELFGDFDSYKPTSPKKERFGHQRPQLRDASKA
jgi:general secretion pathway protein E